MIGNCSKQSYLNIEYNGEQKYESLTFAVDFTNEIIKSLSLFPKESQTLIMKIAKELLK